MSSECYRKISHDFVVVVVFVDVSVVVVVVVVVVVLVVLFMLNGSKECPQE